MRQAPPSPNCSSVALFRTLGAAGLDWRCWLAGVAAPSGRCLSSTSSESFSEFVVGVYDDVMGLTMS